jgi:hypothetical protein
MRQPPELEAVQDRMRSGRFSRDGFLGSDPRPLGQILEEDQNVVNSLGLSHGQIADRMTYFTEAGRRGLGTTVLVDGIYEVRVESVRGTLPSPWGGDGLFPKENVWFRNTETGDELMWTALTIHFIRDHGFYEGRGSAFRIEPETAKRALDL